MHVCVSTHHTYGCSKLFAEVAFETDNKHDFIKKKNYISKPQIIDR